MAKPDINDPIYVASVKQRFIDNGRSPEEMNDNYQSTWIDLLDTAKRLIEAGSYLRSLNESGMPIHMISEAHMRELVKQDWSIDVRRITAFSTAVTAVRISSLVEEALEDVGLTGTTPDTCSAREFKMLANRVTDKLRDRPDLHAMLNTETIFQVLNFMREN